MSELELTGDLAEDINAAIAALAGCLCAGIDPICACGITVGDEFVQIGIDDGCDEGECGQAWVRVTQAYPAVTVGEALVDVNLDCGSMIGLDIEIGVLRCIELPNDGEAMPMSELLRASQQQMKDMVDSRKAILCCDHFPDYVLGVWTPMGPDGPELGGFWNLSVML